MQASPRIRAFIQGFEKLRLVGYLPTPDDKPTNGWGHTGPDVKLGETWTREHADAVWEVDVALREQQLNKLLFAIPTTQGQFDAMFSLLYNIGLANLRTSTLLFLHKTGKYSAASAQFPRWNRQAHKVLPGLTRRRLAEQAIYGS